MTEKTIKDLIEDYRRAVVALERDGGVATAECVEIAQSKLEAGLRARQAPAPVEVSKLIPELAAAGWMLVPTVATTKQRLAMAKADGESGDRYRNMAAAFISAAPVPPNTILASMASTPVGEVPTCVGDTRFEGWLGCHEPDRRDGRRPAYTKQDMRDAYWAGYTERAASPAPAASKPITSAALSIPGAVRAKLSPKAMDMLQRGADALSLEERQSKAEKIASIANIPLAASKGAEAADDPELLALAERAVEAMAKRTPEEASAGFASWIMGPGGSEGTTSTPPPEPEAQKAVAQRYCVNCDCPMPRGCDGTFKGDEHCALSNPSAATSDEPPMSPDGEGPLYAPAAGMEVQGLTSEEVDALDLPREPDHDEKMAFVRALTRALAAKNGWRMGEGQ